MLELSVHHALVGLVGDHSRPSVVVDVMILALDLGKRMGWATGMHEKPGILCKTWGSVDLTADMSPKWTGIAKDGRLIGAVQHWLVHRV